MMEDNEKKEIRKKHIKEGLKVGVRIGAVCGGVVVFTAAGVYLGIPMSIKKDIADEVKRAIDAVAVGGVCGGAVIGAAVGAAISLKSSELEIAAMERERRNLQERIDRSIQQRMEPIQQIQQQMEQMQQQMQQMQQQQENRLEFREINLDCPITNHRMTDPVQIASGISYERDAICDCYNRTQEDGWFICPVTRTRVHGNPRDLPRNQILYAILNEIREREQALRELHQPPVDGIVAHGVFAPGPRATRGAEAALEGHPAHHSSTP
jgi:hypothetical protein